MHSIETYHFLFCINMQFLLEVSKNKKNFKKKHLISTKYNGKFEKICFLENEVVVRILRHGSSIKRHFAGLIFQTKNIVLEQEFFFSRLMAKYPFRNYFISRKRQKTSFKNRSFVHCVERLKCPPCTFRTIFKKKKRRGGDKLATIRCSSPLEESYRIIYLP